MLAISFWSKMVLNLLLATLFLYYIVKTEQGCIESSFFIAGKIISNLSYADAIALKNSNINELLIVLNFLIIQKKRTLNEISRRLSMRKQSTDTFQINGKNLIILLIFVYLGHKHSCKNDQEVVVKHQINLVWAAFGKI